MNSNIISENSLVGDIVREHPEAADVLYRAGMHCVGCHAAVDESLADACAVHAVDPKEIIKAINERIEMFRQYMT